MCGICGIISHSGQPLKEALSRMTASLHHRGPDDRGAAYLEHERVALGHTRLSIHDLSDQGHQPMHSVSGRYSVVFNGEIYNFKAIKKHLSERGFNQWRGHSDTEVFLMLVEVFGFYQALQQIEGMFALCVWDSRDKALYLARDRMGEKPLYYGMVGNSFVFASELKAIKAFSQESMALSHSAIAQFLQFSYVPAPLSIYQGIYKLLPAHYIKIPLEQYNVSHTPKPYWTLPEAKSSIKSSDALEKLSDTLQTVIAEQMISDRPLGAFLSGGIDSSLVVAMMQSQTVLPVNTFSIGFDETSFNEAPFAKKIASHLHCQHHESILSSQQVLNFVDKMPSVYDEPFADSSQLPTYLVCGFAKQHVTVALSGDGADECFGGYTRYIWTQKIWQYIGWLPASIRRLLAIFLSYLPESVLMRLVSLMPKSLRFSHPKIKLNKLCELLRLNGKLALYKRLISTFLDVQGLLNNQHELTPSRFDHLCEDQDTFVQMMMTLDAKTYLPDDIMTKVDRAAMAHSLETRAPFLDRRVVEVAWQLPMTCKIHHGNTKVILRDLLSHFVPKALYERPKMGFGIPINQWLRGELRPWLESLLFNDRSPIYEYINSNKVRDVYTRFIKQQHDNGHQLWALAMLFSWSYHQQSAIQEAPAVC